MEWITTAISWVTSNAPALLQIVGAFAVIATFTPNKADDKVIQSILNWINRLGGNLGKAANDPSK